MWIWKQRWLKPLVLALCLAPLAVLAWLWWNKQLGINSIEYVARYTGRWTLRLFLVSLAITPLRLIKPLSPLIQFRRMLGLVTFFYGCLHALHYWAIDVKWDWAVIQEDLTFRKFFVIGAVSLGLMIPLALTSTDRAIRWMGGRRWQLLHRLAYLSAALGVIHFALQAKGRWDLPPITYGAILVALLLVRLAAYLHKRLIRAH
jgi:sulfoxide reductase heme-binding subunit YedZ